jgi:fructose-bisphosphate aldolase class II
MKALHDILKDADARRAAVGHFNVSDLVALKAVIEGAREVRVPVLVGVSEGERDFIGVRQIAALVRSYNAEEGPPIYLNADHTHSVEKACDAAAAGFDMVVFDASQLQFEESVRATRRAVAAVKSIRADILVEGELGFIGASSSIHDAAPADMSQMTTAEEARQFVTSTDIDILAPSVGTMHGLLKTMVRGEREKRLDCARIAEIRQAAGTFLTLHGGSGTNAADLRAAVRAGITIAHVNTELRLAWRRGLDGALARKPDEVVPYKILPEVVDSIKAVVRDRLELLSADLLRPDGAG